MAHQEQSWENPTWSTWSTAAPTVFSIYSMASPTHANSFQSHYPKPSASAHFWCSQKHLCFAHTYSPTPTQEKNKYWTGKEKIIIKKTVNSHHKYGQFRFNLLKSTSLDHHLPASVFQAGQPSASCSQIKAAWLSDVLSDRWSLWDLQVLSTWKLPFF